MIVVLLALLLGPSLAQLLTSLYQPPLIETQAVIILGLNASSPLTTTVSFMETYSVQPEVCLSLLRM
jgi:hypothetical protein